jgi:hypothetical protein
MAATTRTVGGTLDYINFHRNLHRCLKPHLDDPFLLDHTELLPRKMEFADLLGKESVAPLNRMEFIVHQLDLSDDNELPGKVWDELVHLNKMVGVILDRCIQLQSEHVEATKALHLKQKLELQLQLQLQLRSTRA